MLLLRDTRVIDEIFKKNCFFVFQRHFNMRQAQEKNCLNTTTRSAIHAYTYHAPIYIYI